MSNITIERADLELPICTDKWGWKFHHLGIPTTIAKPDEQYIPQYKMFVSGFKTSPFGIEWMRFEKESPVDALIQTVPHIAFEVDDLNAELAKGEFTLITKPNSPSEGVYVAMIVHNGAPVELIEFEQQQKSKT